MKMCQEHLIHLKKCLSERGLDNLIREDVGSIMTNIEKQYMGDNIDGSSFDPLFDAMLNIMTAAVAMTEEPSYLFWKKEDGSEYCPVCEAYLHKGDFQLDGESVTDERFNFFWFESLADFELETARKLGVAPNLN